MNEIPTREILWNVGTLPNIVLMYTLMTLSLIVAFVGVFRHAELWRSGKKDPSREGLSFDRVRDLFTWALLQRGVVRERGPALAHTLIYIGFLVLLFTTTMVFIDNDLGIKIYNGEFYLVVTFLSDIFGAGVLFGILIAAHRRYIKSDNKVHNRLADSFMLFLLGLMIIQGFLLEGLRIHATEDQWASYSPIGSLVSGLFWPLSYEATVSLHFGVWWFHTATVFLFIALIPYSKFFHIISSSLNLFFRSSKRPKGALESPGDLEKIMESGEEVVFGLGSIKDYNWKELLDLDACTSCGRCQDACPAYNTGKPLSPKWIVLDTRNHALLLNATGKLTNSALPSLLTKVDQALTVNAYLGSSGLISNGEAAGYSSNGAYRGANELVQKNAGVLGRSADDRIAGDVISADAFWSCTTCMACVEACPVGINHVDQIVGNRRNMALMHGEIPNEAQGTLRALENRSNPFGAPQDRTKWLTGIDVPIIKAGEQVDYLYWVGCVSAFDPRKQKIARSLVTIMKSAGLSFGILGTEEGCSGDPARRLGEENLFQSLAKKNLELLRSVSFKYLVANCPHCFNSIKNEYPQFGNLANGEQPEIIHHSVLLKRLLKEEKIKLKEGSAETVTFHDPCYLGRYNDEYDAPRDTLKAIKGLTIVEMDKNREKSFCCGAGGGHFWMDMKIGTRVNVTRTEHAAATHASTVATGCPFCLQMMEDGVKLTGKDEEMKVKDLAEIVAENLA